jgi:hypothetical protein
MKAIILFIVLLTVAAAASGQTNAPPTLYVHFGIGQGTNAVQVLCTKVHLGEQIFVSSADLRYIRPWNNWKLTGHVDQRGAEMTADLLGSSASESQFYRGKMTPEMPCFAQGGAASGGAGGPMWFVVSTNMESKPILDKLQDMDTQTRKNSP